MLLPSVTVDAIICRLGITASNQQDPDDEVNEFLGSSIEARSIDKLVFSYWNKWFSLNYVVFVLLPLLIRFCWTHWFLLLAVFGLYTLSGQALVTVSIVFKL